ncbi:MAG TPA: choice-of-anchor J domain-containing protein, partial [Candidatus Cloacimonadota bacterium]|nr:choice-of-anchor J domain-containing protein [Candidatus Cloacimonadota bacterium]
AEQWYWNVVAYNATGTASPLIGMNYFILERETFATESFEVGNVENYDNIFEWTQVYGYGYSQWLASKNQTTYNRSPRTGNWNLTMYYATEYFSFGWLFHPYPLIGGVTYDVELFARQATDMNGNALIGIYFGTSGTEAAMTTEITPEYMVQIVNGDYQRVSGSFTPSTTGTYYMGIRNRVAGQIYYMSLDDITVRASTLPNPVTMVSPANLATGQPFLPTLSWTPASTGGLATSYKVYCQASTTPITPSTLIATVDAASNHYTFTTPLSGGTTYYWMVVATNGHGDAVSSPVRSFTILESSLLYETFGSGYDIFPPANWHCYEGELSNPSNLSQYNWAWGSNNWINTVVSPTNRAANLNIWGENYRWLVTPPLQLDGAAFQLQLDIALTDWNSNLPITSDENGTTGYDDRFVILIGDGSSWTPANILREWNNSGSPYVYNDIPNIGLHVSIPLDAYSGVKYIAFYGASSVANADNDIFLDNIHVFVPYINDLAALSLIGATDGITGTPITYTVNVVNFGTAVQTGYTVNLKSVSPAMTLATLNITTSLASGASAYHNLTWTPTTPGLESEIYAEVVLASDQAMSNNATSNIQFFSHVAGALVESFESGIPGNWTVADADGNGRSWLSDYAQSHSGSKTAYVLSNWGQPNDDWLITPPLQLSSGTTDMISFWMKGYDPAYPEPWEVLISTTDSEPGSFTLIDSGILADPDYIQKTYNLDSYGNAIIYFAVRYRSNYTELINVDDFHGPVVYNPTSLSTPDVTITTSGMYLLLNWTVVPYASEYHIYSSDDAINWSTSYTVVKAPLHTTYYNPAAGGLKFFKVVAVTGQNRSTPAILPPTKEDKSRFEALKKRLKMKQVGNRE